MVLNGSLCNHPPFKIACLKYLPYILWTCTITRHRLQCITRGRCLRHLFVCMRLSLWVLEHWLLIFYTIAKYEDNQCLKKCLSVVLPCQITNSPRSLYNIICACGYAETNRTFMYVFASMSRFTHTLSFFLWVCARAPSNTYSLYNTHPCSSSSVPSVCVCWNVWTTYSKGFHSFCLAKLMATSIMTSSQHSVIGLQTLSLSANHVILCWYTPSSGYSNWLRRRG